MKKGQLILFEENSLLNIPSRIFGEILNIENDKITIKFELDDCYNFNLNEIQDITFDASLMKLV